MQINVLSSEHAVSPQICCDDIAAIKAAGYKSIICNRPDYENPENLHSVLIKAAAETVGLTFADHPFDSGSFGVDVIQQQSVLFDQLPKPVFAYCASGTRCSTVWSFVQAQNKQPVTDILDATRRAGYDFSYLRPQLVQFGATEG